MNQKELKELIEFLIEKDIAEFELERGGTGGGGFGVLGGAWGPAGGSWDCVGSGYSVAHDRAGGRARNTRGTTSTGSFADRGNFLRSAFSGGAALRQGWRSSRSGTG